MQIGFLAQSAVSAALAGPAPTATVDHVLSPYIYVFYVAFIVTYCFTPVMRHVALYYGIIDRPDLGRKLHAAPVAYLGGAAVFIGWIGGLAITQFTATHRPEADLPHLRWPTSMILAAAMIVVLGLWDDIKKATPRLKIVAQVLAALALLHANIGTNSTGPLLTPVIVRLSRVTHWNPHVFHSFVTVSSYLLTIALVVGCCNATNLMDGLDGLCGGVTAIITAGFLFLVVHMATFGNLGNTNTDGQRVVLALALLGAVLGFVPFNFSPASIFLGDTGSMFIGFSCATLITMMAEERPKWFLAAMVMFALPILDTTLAFARRFVNGRPLFSADRHHIHHQLVARGFTVRQTVIISYGLAVFFVMIGGAIAFMRTRYVAACYLVIFGSIIVAAYKMGMVHEVDVVEKRKGLTDTGSLRAEAAAYDSDMVLEVRDQRTTAPDDKVEDENDTYTPT
jgi:UDP-GlcNAc:undecaprenyl-phosphate GlcNAc-1-phosphate transferase